MSFRTFLKTTAVGRVALIPWRLKNALGICLPRLGQCVSWAFGSREYYNFTYNLTGRNMDYLAAFLAVVAKSPFPGARKFLDEIENDAELRSEIGAMASQSVDRHVTDPDARYGRRSGWYALVRLLKPGCVVETGVDKGLGTCVIAAALRRNAAEGFPGKVIAIDINPAAGSLVSPSLRKYVDFRFRDSLAALKDLDQTVDMFIHDSDHTEEHERLEYEAVAPRLGPTSLVVSDNAAHSGELVAFARKNGRQFLYFTEDPKDHWWSGEGIGVAFRPEA